MSGSNQGQRSDGRVDVGNSEVLFMCYETEMRSPHRDRLGPIPTCQTHVTSDRNLFTGTYRYRPPRPLARFLARVFLLLSIPLRHPQQNDFRGHYKSPGQAMTALKEREKKQSGGVDFLRPAFAVTA